jgi:hypothetical protein
MDDLAVTIVNIGAIIVCIAGVTRSWLIAKGDLLPVYWLMIVMGIANGAANFAMLWRNSEFWGLWGYQVLVFWSLIMGVKGLLRLRRERDNN